MKQSEQLLIFGLGALFHAARIAGATARGESEFPAVGNSIDEAITFIDAAKSSGVFPDLPDDEPRKP